MPWLRGQLWPSLSSYVRRTPGTHVYLFVLLVTTATVHSVNRVLADQLLRQVSTNLVEMGRSAGRVLFLSAFLLDGGSRWVVEALLFTIVYVPMERWAGTWRWLGVVVGGHVGGTLVTTVGIWADVRYNRGAAALVRTIDVGVSYGFVAVAGFLMFAIRGRWWRLAYVALWLAILGTPLVRSHTFTDAGHFSALVIGAAMYPVFRPELARRRPLAGPSSLRTWWAARRASVPAPAPPGTPSGTAPSP